MTTRTPPLLTLSRAAAAPVLVWDQGKMPTKDSKSTNVFWAEQAAKAARRQELYAAAGLLSSSKSVSSESVAPVQLPLGSKSLKYAQQTMATWLSPQATTPPESPHLKRGSENKRVQVNSPDPLSSVHISRGSRGSKPSDLAGNVISMSDEGINSPLGLHRHPSRGSPWLHACPQRSLPPRPFLPTCL